MLRSVVLQDLYSSDLPYLLVWGMENGNQTLEKSNALVNLTVICNCRHNTWHCTDTCVNSMNTSWYTYCEHTHIHIANCGAPLTVSNNSIITISNSTLEGSTLHFSCREGFLPSDIITAMCFPNRSWTPDPTTHMCKPITSSGREIPIPS